MSFLSILQYNVYRNVLKIKINGINYGRLNTSHIWFLTNFFWIDKIDQTNFYSRWTYRSSRGRSAKSLIESVIILQAPVGEDKQLLGEKFVKKKKRFIQWFMFVSYIVPRLESNSKLLGMLAVRLLNERSLNIILGVTNE